MNDLFNNIKITIKGFTKYAKHSNHIKAKKISMNNLEIENKLFSKIQVGDIVIAKSRSKDNPKNSYGTYIVVSKNNKELICVYGKNEIFKYFDSDYIVPSSLYQLPSDTYFITTGLIAVKKMRLKSIIGHLNDDDLQTLLKKIKVNHGNYYYINSKKFTLEINDIENQKGDVISFNDTYFLVTNVIDDQLECLKFNGDYNTFNNIDYTEKHYLKKDRLYDLVKCYDKQYIKLINKRYDLLQIQKKLLSKKELVKRGSILVKDQNYFYVYGFYEKDALAYPLLTKKKYLYDEINVDDQKFYTNYSNSVYISKYDDSYVFYKQLNDNQIYDIKLQKKAYKKNNHISNQGKKSKTNYNLVNAYDILIGSVIVSDDHKYYYIYDQEPDRLFAVVIYPNSKGNFKFSINNKIYSSTLKKHLSINKTDIDFNVVDIANEQEISIISNLIYQPLKKEQDNLKDSIKKGSVVQINDNLCYLCGESIDTWFGILISNDKTDSFNKTIVINKLIYYADFSNMINISKNNNVNFLMNASLNDINNINRQLLLDPPQLVVSNKELIKK